MAPDIAGDVNEVVSDWLLIDQAMIDRFAEATGDHQFIHVDTERARGTPFGGTIAHGFLILALLTRLRPAPQDEGGGAGMEINYGSNKTRFVSPVRSGKRIRGRFKVIELIEKRQGQFQKTVEAVVEIEGEEKPALICEWITPLFPE